MRRCCTAVLLVIALALGLTSCGPKSISMNILQTKEFTWQPFRWVPFEFASAVQEKAAIFVPIQFGGSDHRYWMQLDTGATTQVRGNAFNSLGIQHKVVRRDKGYDVVELDAAVAGYDTHNVRLCSMENQGAAIDPSATDVRIGTLGMDFFMDKILVLDFPNARLGIATTVDQLPNGLVDSARFFPAETMRSWLVIQPRVGEVDLKVAYDTGASLMPLTLDQPLWRKVTGRNGDEADNLRADVPSWGKIITIVGAPTKEEMMLGELSLGHPNAFYEQSTTNLVFEGSGAHGVMGNSPFYDHYIVILDPLGKRFGLVDTRNP